MTPLGLASDIPIIMSDRISSLTPAFLWLGGGHKDVKFGCPVEQLLSATGATVADITYD